MLRFRSSLASRAAPLLAALALGAACGDSDARQPLVDDRDPLSESVSAAPSERATPPATPIPAAPPQLVQPADALYVSVSRAIEAGDGAAARRDSLALAPSLHSMLLGARLLALEGDSVGAVRALEAARAARPEQGAVYATAAEIHAAGGRLQSAEDEIRDGLRAAGETPELLRARGVLALCREGGARTGLGHLLAARRAAPGLEFSTHMLAEAYRLLAAAALGEANPQEAVGFAREAFALAPDDAETRELLADALAAQGDFTGALEQYEGLLSSGRDVRAACALMNVRGATAALLESNRELAIARYSRARALGSSDEELGFGANVLEEELRKVLARGVEATERADWTAARAAFEQALRIEPQLLEAHNQLGIALFRLGDHEGAAASWRAVLERAEREALELPDPVHLNLARALYQLGRRDEVKTLLESWLERHGASEHAAATRDMLARL